MSKEAVRLVDEFESWLTVEMHKMLYELANNKKLKGFEWDKKLARWHTFDKIRDYARGHFLHLYP